MPEFVQTIEWLETDLELGWARSEQLTMGDGQLGTAILDSGPEGANPEGSAGIAQPFEPARLLTEPEPYEKEPLPPPDVRGRSR